MGLDATSELGRFIGGLANSQVSLTEDAIPDDIQQSLILSPIDGVTLSVEVSFYQRDFSSTGLYLSHPLYGVMDNSTLLMDGDYDSSTLIETYEG